MKLKWALGFLLITLTGCMEKPDHKPDPGTEIPLVDIQKAITSSMPPDPESMKEGQYVSIDISQALDTQPPVTVQQRLDKVVKREEDDQRIWWTFDIEMNELLDGTWKHSKMSEGPLCMDKIPGSKACQAQDLMQKKAADSLKVYSLKGLQTLDNQEPLKVTYHNLTVDEGYLPVPSAVKMKPDCGGVKNCQMGLRYYRVSFDRRIWETEEKSHKTTYKLTYSADVPTYIYDWLPGDVGPTNQLQFCARTWLEIKNGDKVQQVPVQECADLRDFQFGK